MKKTHRLIAWLLLGSFLVVGLSACFGQEPSEPSLEYLLRMGRENLEAGKGSIAYNYFQKAIERAPDNYEAHYGIVLSLDKRIFANIDGIIDMLAGVYIYEPSRDECEVAAARLAECGWLDEAWTDAEHAIADCPWRLQKWMFYYVIEGDHTCHEIRRDAMDWLIPPSPDNCQTLCENLEMCGLMQPPVTFDFEQCIEHCPYSYVERHSRCLLAHADECNGYDRTCFMHITTGLQILFREIGIGIPPQIIEYTEWILEHPDDFQYDLEDYAWTLVDPPVQIELDGRYDEGFLHLSRGLSETFYAFLLLATSVHLEMNFTVLDLEWTYPKPEGLQETLRGVILTLEILMYDVIFPQGFSILDEPWAYDQIREGGQALGRAAGSIADMFGFLLADRDRQKGKALAYDDANGNFVWDEGETVPIRGLDIEVSREQAKALIDVCRALEANLLEREPIDLEVVYPLLDSFNAGSLAWLADLGIAWSDDGTLDISEAFYNPQRDSFRELLTVVLEKLRIIETIIVDSDS